jgi:FkbM family methyltransferase
METTMSDVGQDLWVIEKVMQTMLQDGYAGYFIEAGASDGVAGSNTLVLERNFEWQGLLVEPNEYFFERLKGNRPRSHCRHCVLSDSDGEIEFIQAGYFGTAPDHVRSVFDRRGLDISSHQNYQEDVGLQKAKRGLLPARSLESLLKQVNAPQTIDYFSLDVEGGEMHVLSGFPWGTRRIASMTVESAFYVDGVLYDADHRKPVREFLEAKGMRYVGSLEFDDCYVDPTIVTWDVTP